MLVGLQLRPQADGVWYLCWSAETGLCIDGGPESCCCPTCFDQPGAVCCSSEEHDHSAPSDHEAPGYPLGLNDEHETCDCYHLPLPGGQIPVLDQAIRSLRELGFSVVAELNAGEIMSAALPLARERLYRIREWGPPRHAAAEGCACIWLC